MAAHSATESGRAGRRAAGRAGLALLGLLACVTAARATAARSVAARTWTEAATAHVDVLTDAGRQVGERVAGRLEDLRTVLALAAPALVVDVSPVQVIVFRDSTLARAYSPRWRGLRDNVSGFFQAAPDRRRLLFVDDLGRTPSVAQHEYVHALLDAAMPEAPLWLNEGLAEYFGTFTASGGRAEAGAPQPGQLEWLRHHDLMPVSRLFAVTQASPEYHEGDRRGTFYAESWLLTHMLLSGTDDDLSRLERVIRAARDGERFAVAFRRVFGDETTLGERLSRYLDRPRFAVRTWRLQQPAAARAVRVRDRVAAAGVLASLGTALLARPAPQREDAEEHLRLALELDPQNAEACAATGWLASLRGQAAEARRWYARAVTGEPVSLAATRLAAALVLAEPGSQSSEAERRDAAMFARRALARARERAPDDPELLALLARTYVVWHGEDPSEGWPLAVRAAEALPGRADVQLDELALAALTGRTSRAMQLYDARFRSGDSPELGHVARVALLAGDVRAANQRLAAADAAGAESLLVAARGRFPDDAGVVRDADRYLEHVRGARTAQGETERENAAIARYNAGAAAANARHWADAAAAFREAAAGSRRDEFRRGALRLAARMEMHANGERALELARAGDSKGALALFEAMDRSVMDADDRRWWEHNVALLRRPRAR